MVIVVIIVIVVEGAAIALHTLATAFCLGKLLHSAYEAAGEHRRTEIIFIFK